MKYRITIATFDEEYGRWKGRVVITCESKYLLDPSIAEWVKEEIDPKAEILTEE